MLPGSSKEYYESVNIEKDYLHALAVMPDNLDIDDPQYQPQEFLEFNYMSTFNQEIFQCLNCKTVVTFHDYRNQDECPFCHRVLTSKSVQILKHVDLQDASIIAEESYQPTI
jgi:hypothetical protein